MLGLFQACRKPLKNSTTFPGLYEATFNFHDFPRGQTVNTAQHTLAQTIEVWNFPHPQQWTHAHLCFHTHECLTSTHCFCRALSTEVSSLITPWTPDSAITYLTPDSAITYQPPSPATFVLQLDNEPILTNTYWKQADLLHKHPSVSLNCSYRSSL